VTRRCTAELAYHVGATFRGFAVRCDVEGPHEVHSALLSDADGADRVRLPAPRLLRTRPRGPVRDVSGAYRPDVLEVRVTWRDPAEGELAERRAARVRAAHERVAAREPRRSRRFRRVRASRA
jgi:hypothetical protein